MVGHRQYMSEYEVRARGGDMATLAQIPLINIRRIEGVRYVDEIAFHRTMRARERNVAIADNQIETKRAKVRSHRSLGHMMGLWTVTLSVGSLITIGALYYTSVITNDSGEKTFTHSVGTSDSVSYSTLEANPFFVLKDISKLLRTHVWKMR